MYCEHCGVKIDCPAEKCPLCHKPLKSDEKTKKEAIFPKAKIKRRRPDKFTVDFFLCVAVIIIVCIALNLVYTPEFLWSTIVLVCLVYVFYCVRFTFIAQKNFNAKIFGQAVSLTALFVAVRLIVGGNHFIFITWLPIVYLLSDVLLLAYIIINKREARKKIISIIEIGVLGVIPVSAAYIFDLSVKWPSIAVSALSIALVLGTLIFGRKHILGELKRFFHI